MSAITDLSALFATFSIAPTPPPTEGKGEDVTDYLTSRFEEWGLDVTTFSIPSFIALHRDVVERDMKSSALFIEQRLFSALIGYLSPSATIPSVTHRRYNEGVVALGKKMHRYFINGKSATFDKVVFQMRVHRPPRSKREPSPHRWMPTRPTDCV